MAQYPNPDAVVITAVKAFPAKPFPYTCSTSFPGQDVATPAAITVPHVQIAWDGTPVQDASHEGAVVRVTAWGTKGRPSDAKSLASWLQDRLVPVAGSSVIACWQIERAAGRVPGIDPDTALPFCTFTVTADLRPL